MQKKVKWISIAVVLLVFAAGTYIFTSGSEGKLTSGPDSQPMRKAKPVDEEDLPVKWTEADTYEEVQAFYEERVPRLEKARAKELTTFPEQTATVPGLDGRLQINEVWHSGQTMYFMYSLDLSLLVEQKEDEKENSFFDRSPELQEMTITTNEGDEHPLHAYSSMRFPDVITYKNRLYGVIQSIPVSENGLPLGQMGTMNATINEQFDTSLNLRINGETYQSEPIPVSYVYDPEQSKIGTYTFSDQYEQNGITIEPLELVMTLSADYIDLKIESENKSFQGSLEGAIETGEKATTFAPYIQPVEESDNIYRAYIPPLENLPEDLSLRIDQVHFSEESGASFTVDIPEKGEEQQFNENKIVEKYDTTVFLKSVRNETAGEFIASLKTERQSENQQQFLLEVSPEYHFSYRNDRDSITFKTDRGFSGTPSFSKQSTNGGLTRLHVPQHMLKGSEQITFTFNNLLYAQKIDRTFSIDE
ncbi:hypothetical protein EQV77_15545 [Halobacillus fulvus]|nr:hypothetical protein EQV77_15545 [Halobacillus fulvus]